jgi:hypothetical protein
MVIVGGIIVDCRCHHDGSIIGGVSSKVFKVF